VLFSVVRLPASPAAEIKLKQHFKMTTEKEKAQQDSNRLSMKTMRQAESSDKAAKQKTMTK
jgi:hypothetical protein